MRKNLGGLFVVIIAAAIAPAPAAAQLVTLNITPIPATQRLIERQTQDVAFTFKLEPGKTGRGPEVNYPIEVLVCGPTGETSTNCVSFNGLTPTVTKSGTLSLRLPLGGPAVAIRLVACAPKRDANQVATCGKVYASAEFNHAIFARFEAGIDSFTINHTRAQTSDTLYIGYAGLFANNVVDAATSQALDACDNIIGPPTVEKPILCRNQARYGTKDLRDGTFPGRTDLGVGVFEVIPGTGGRLNFGFVVFNFGFPGEPSDARDRMIGNSHNVIRGQLVQQSGQFGVFEIVKAPLNDITDKLNGSPWLGCDGPTAGGVFTIPNDNSGQSLDALTSGSGKHVFVPKFVVKSQVGCGASSRYTVSWFVRRTTW
jgi:hypothetical protein